MSALTVADRLMLAERLREAAGLLAASGRPEEQVAALAVYRAARVVSR